MVTFKDLKIGTFSKTLSARSRKARKHTKKGAGLTLKAKPKCKCFVEQGLREEKLLERDGCQARVGQVLPYGFPACAGSATARRRWALQPLEEGNGPKRHTGQRETKQKSV